MLDSPVLVKDTTRDDIPNPCDRLFVVGLLYLQPDGEDLAAHGSEVRALRHGEAGKGVSWHDDKWVFSSTYSLSWSTTCSWESTEPSARRTPSVNRALEKTETYL